MSAHFRTITAVVRVAGDSDLGGPGFAVYSARDALASAGFDVVGIRNEHNETGEMPRRKQEGTDPR